MCFFRDNVFVRGGHDGKNHACFHNICIYLTHSAAPEQKCTLIHYI